MPRSAASRSIDDIVRDAVDGVVKRASAAIARVIAELAAERLDRELGTGLRRARAGAIRARGKAGKRRARRRTEITRWAADRRARRVPKFVIEATGGLDTKKKIVAKYGEGAAFEKGKPPPKAK